MVNTFGTARTPSTTLPAVHQDRVNVEMFKAIELLGKKLERAEGERDRLQRRLAMIESAATVDEKTGKLYLPVVVDPKTAPQFAQQGAPKWTAAASLMSSAIALLAISIVMFREPAQTLTPQQIAALNSLSLNTTQLAKYEKNTWKRIEPKEEAQEVEGDIAAGKFLAQKNEAAEKEEALPDNDMLALEESNAEHTETAMTEKAREFSAIEPAAVKTQEEEPEAFIPGESEEQEKKTVVKTEAVKKPVAEEEPAESVQAAKIEPVEEETIAQAPKAVEPPKTETATPAQKTAEAAITSDGIAPDPLLPAKLAALEKRAFEDIPEAQHDLATLYASGKMVGQDYKRAAYWFAKSADGGIANAHYNLGVMFQQGLGVRQDMKKAISWYEKAAELGHPEAMYNLGIAFIEGVGTERNIDRGISFFKRAANTGVSQAAYNLGVLYESNFIGPIDTAKALEWYQVAANEKHADAEAAIERLKNQMSDVSDQALTLADMVEPAAGDEDNAEEVSGQGDGSLPGDDLPAITAKDAAAPDMLLLKIQELLVKQGMLPGKATGKMDQQTEDSIRAFQKQQGLRIDGVPSDELLDTIEKVSGKN